MTTQPNPTHDELKGILDLNNESYVRVTKQYITAQITESERDRQWKNIDHNILEAITNLYNAKFERALGPEPTRSRSKEAARAIWYSDQKEGPEGGIGHNT